jgi:hypothetical protein
VSLQLTFKTALKNCTIMLCLSRIRNGESRNYNQGRRLHSPTVHTTPTTPRPAHLLRLLSSQSSIGPRALTIEISYCQQH